MSHDDVEEYLTRTKSLIDSAPQMGEENTKVKLIQPLIELLGWDVYSSEVELEYPLQIGQGQARADYALLVKDTPVVFIEAKGCDASLSDKDRNQLKSYIRQKGADWGLLTNGRRFEVLKRRKDSDLPEEVLLASFSIDEFETNWGILELLSKELVRSGEADKIADRIEARRRATDELRSEKEPIADEVAQVIVERVGNALVQEIEAESKEFIDDLIEVLGTDEDVTTLPERDRTGSDSVSSDVKKYLITLYDNGNPVQTLSEDSQADVMAAAIDLLVENHGLLDEIGSLPYVPGRKNAILNSKPEHPTGERMSLYRSLSDSCYLYVSLNKDSKMRYVDQFAGMCGLAAEFDGSW